MVCGLLTKFHKALYYVQVSGADGRAGGGLGSEGRPRAAVLWKADLEVKLLAILLELFVSCSCEHLELTVLLLLRLQNE